MADALPRRRKKTPGAAVKTIRARPLLPIPGSGLPPGRCRPGSRPIVSALPTATRQMPAVHCMWTLGIAPGLSTNSASPPRKRGTRIPEAPRRNAPNATIERGHNPDKDARQHRHRPARGAPRPRPAGRSLAVTFAGARFRPSGATIGSIPPGRSSLASQPAGRHRTPAETPAQADPRPRRRPKIPLGIPSTRS